MASQLRSTDPSTDPSPTPTARRSLDDLCPSRRSLLAAIGGAVILPGVLVACGSSDSGDSGSGDGGDEGSGASGSVAAADVAVGTAVVVDAGGESVVVAQVTEGEYVAFSANCTHQGTVVDSSDSLVVTCPNHGSEFDLADGAAVVTGPATIALPAVTVTLEGDQLVFS